MSQRAATPPDVVVVPAKGRSLAKFAVNGTLCIIGVMFALPMGWLVLSAFDLHADWAIRVPTLTLDNLGLLLQLPNSVQTFGNSLYIAGVTTLVTTFCGFLAAYALSRHFVPLKRSLMLVILFATGLPITMLLVPLYQMYVLMGWLDSLFTTSLFLSATSIPFAIWLMKNFIDAVPAELEQAAQLEGTGTATMLRKVVLPLSWPGVMVAAIYTFINAWGAFLVPLVLNTSPNQLPGSIAIYYFLGDQGVVQFGGLAMYSLLFSLPVVVLYLATSRYFAGSFSFGGALRG